MSNTNFLIMNFSTLCLLYVIMYFTQNLSSKRQFYGVSLNSDYFSKKEFKSLDKKYKTLLTIGFILFTIVMLIFIYMFKAYEVSSIVPPLGFTIYSFIVFIYIYNKVKNSKQILSLDNNDVNLEKTKFIIDTDFINSKNKIIKLYSILLLIPLFILMLVCIYTISKYNTMPDIIPTHWGINGKADAFSKKSIASLGSIILMSIFTGLLIYISSLAALRTRFKLNPNSIEESKIINLRYLNKFGITFLILNISMNMLFISTLVATVNSSDLNIYIMLFTTISLIFSSIYLIYIYYKLPNNSKNVAYTVDDNDSKWILGSFYYNKNDPSLFVQKRFGVGWTVNLATKKGKIYIIIPFIIIIINILMIYFLK